MTDNGFSIFNWESNPFTFKIMPGLFVGHDEEVQRLTMTVNSGDKFSLLLGATGSGKTTMLRWISDKFPNFQVLYLSKPPKDPDDWVRVFKDVIKNRSLFSLFTKNDNTDLYNLSDKINKKLDNRKFLLFVDECHEASLESLEWLRTLTDQIDNLSIVLAGLPVFEKMLKDNLETFNRRINRKIELRNLDRHETRELIKKRIENVGGSDINPFTSGTIEHIYQKTGGFPRDVLKLCGDLVEEALKRRMTTIDTDFLKERSPSMNRSEVVSVEKIEELPPRQKSILDALNNGEILTPAQIIDKIDISEYKSRDNAVRSVNNLLRRLMSDGFIERKKIGKTYKYCLSGKYQTVFVDA